MWKKLSCLLLCIAMLAGLAGCGKAAPDTGRSEGKTVDKVTSTDNAAAADTAAQNKAYGAALWDIYLYGILPDNSKLDYSSTQQAEENTFAIYDVDHDGREELIVQWSAHAAMASQMCLIYGYDNGKLHEELSEFVDTRFYSNGAVEASWSHNQGLGGRIWPYNVYTYDAKTDSYRHFGAVDGWDKSYMSTYYGGGEPFPDDLDQDGDRSHLLPLLRRRDPHLRRRGQRAESGRTGIRSLAAVVPQRCNGDHPAHEVHHAGQHHAPRLPDALKRAGIPRTFISEPPPQVVFLRRGCFFRPSDKIARILPHRAGREKLAHRALILCKVLRLADTAQRPLGVGKAAAEIAPRLLHTKQQRAPVGDARARGGVKPVVKRLKLCRRRHGAGAQLADEAGIGSQPAAEHDALHGRKPRLKRAHGRGVKQVAVVAHGSAAVRERVGEHVKIRVPVVLVGLHARVHDQLADRVVVIQLQQRGNVSAVALPSRVLTDTGSGQTANTASKNRRSRSGSVSRPAPFFFAVTVFDGSRG